ncbi:organic solute transporter subunit alpha [Sarotherodon galilaeus]
METSGFVQDKLTEWGFSEFMQRFKDEGIDKEAFLSLESSRINTLIPKIGPRVKFKRRLREYLQDLNRTNDDSADMMETSAEQEDSPEMEPNIFPQHLESVSASDTPDGKDTSNEPICSRATVTEGQSPTMFYCQECKNFMGNNPDSCCSHCASVFNKASSIQNGNFFLYSSLKDLLKGILENHSTELLPKTVKDEHDNIKDVMDGMMYQNLLREGKLAADDLTLTWNFDEVPIFSTTRYSIWPLQFVINELPYTQRQENMIVAGFWFGQGKPHMNTFLKPFVDECCDLAQNPFQWRDSRGTPHSSKVFCLVCSSDAVARPLLRNCKQFNGEYGCDWCLHPGTVVTKGSGSVRSYRYDETKQASRSKNMFVENGREAESSHENTSEYGVKGMSLLSRLPLFDIVFGFVPEYMHSVLVGVTKQLFGLWLNSENSMKDWYVGQQISQMDSYLQMLKPPSEMSRSPQSLKGRDTWKASEWRAFLLFYAVSVLPGFLQPPFLQHFFCLSVSIHILLQESVSQNDLQLAHENLVLFVRNMEELYGEENVSFNCHQLIHLSDCVRNWGPLWATSAFSFERNSANLRALLSNINYNPKKIQDKFLCWQCLPSHLRSLVSDGNSPLARISPVNDTTDCYNLLGNSRHLDITGSIKLAIEELLNRPVSFRSVEAFDSFINRNTVYSVNHEETDRTDCVIKLKNGCYGEIQFIVRFKENCVCTSNCVCSTISVIVVQLFYIKLDAEGSRMIPDSASRTIFVEVERTTQLKAFFLKDVRCKCMYVDGWLVPLPNSYERY